LTDGKGGPGKVLTKQERTNNRDWWKERREKRRGEGREGQETKKIREKDGHPRYLNMDTPMPGTRPHFLLERESYLQRTGKQASRPAAVCPLGLIVGRSSAASVCIRISTSELVSYSSPLPSHTLPGNDQSVKKT